MCRLLRTEAGAIELVLLRVAWRAGVDYLPVGGSADGTDHEHQHPATRSVLVPILGALWGMSERLLNRRVLRTAIRCLACCNAHIGVIAQLRDSLNLGVLVDRALQQRVLPCLPSGKRCLR